MGITRSFHVVLNDCLLQLVSCSFQGYMIILLIGHNGKTLHNSESVTPVRTVESMSRPSL